MMRRAATPVSPLRSPPKVRLQPARSDRLDLTNAPSAMETLVDSWKAKT